MSVTFVRPSPFTSARQGTLGLGPDVKRSLIRKNTSLMFKTPLLSTSPRPGQPCGPRFGVHTKTSVLDAEGNGVPETVASTTSEPMVPVAAPATAVCV